MSRLPSEATQLRTARTEIKRLGAQCALYLTQRDQYRARATAAEQECADWKRRFDALLMRTPKEPT